MDAFWGSWGWWCVIPFLVMVVAMAGCALMALRRGHGCAGCRHE